MKHPHGLAYLRVFETVARIGSVRSAAIELNVTPGAVSQQIHNLQDALGVPLFVRDGRRLRPTEAGRALQRSAAVAFSEIDSCVEEIAKPGALPVSRSVTIAVPPALAVSWFATQMFDFAQVAGLTKFRILSAVDFAQVDWRLADIAIVYGSPPWKGFSWSLMANIVLRPVCSPRLLNSSPSLKSPRDVSDHWLLHEDDGSEWLRWLTAANVSQTASRNAHFSTLMMAMTAALEGRGLALVSDFLASDYLQSGRLVRPFETGIEGSRSYYCVCAESRATEPQIMRMTEWILDRSRMQQRI
ncbi:LysR family transcriptional regulator [Mesorhizobium sp. INR15]|uniref:LysR family transcriptional regulator n=1 Tax=Mesorhizobium sp. INR15 TaxID=2654248 RepID=UPI0018966C4C|nr:LysR family transcriptional regulator [Mesorhizobium sp. INR15]QPC93353.1 LysR family transcriptional regulator [Mesorhizobium sp. INR15]